ncbi:hypothetical protein [Deinococcus yavapaiensis]|uniref:hypothetical protein n=1 Tax=Deinococcus yavapaiensis TaxID=309889 RepID=UPI000DA24D4D|nr:hypothetical protein [Deinococcus yavapaiensis]
MTALTTNEARLDSPEFDSLSARFPVPRESRGESTALAVASLFYFSSFRDVAVGLMLREHVFEVRRSMIGLGDQEGSPFEGSDIFRFLHRSFM